MSNLPRLPEGLRDITKSLTKEILREKPKNIYEFAAQYFERQMPQSDMYDVSAYEEPGTYTTLLKTTGKHTQIPIALVYAIMPDRLIEFIKDFIKAVLKQNPRNICHFAVHYFRHMHKERPLELSQTDYEEYERYLKSKGRYAYPIKCTCGRWLGRATTISTGVVAECQATEGNHLGKSTLNETVAVKNDKSQNLDENSVKVREAVERSTAVKKLNDVEAKPNGIQEPNANSEQLVQKLTEGNLTILNEQNNKLKVQNSNRESHDKYLNAVHVIQRFLRKCLLRRKTLKNRTLPKPSKTMTDEMAALIIQRTLRKMFTTKKQQQELVRTPASAVLTDSLSQIDERSDISEATSYTSASTVLAGGIEDKDTRSKDVEVLSVLEENLLTSTNDIEDVSSTPRIKRGTNSAEQSIDTEENNQFAKDEKATANIEPSQRGHTDATSEEKTNEHNENNTESKEEEQKTIMSIDDNMENLEDPTNEADKLTDGKKNETILDGFREKYLGNSFREQESVTAEIDNPEKSNEHDKDKAQDDLDLVDAVQGIDKGDTKIHSDATQNSSDQYTSPEVLPNDDEEFVPDSIPTKDDTLQMKNDPKQDVEKSNMDKKVVENVAAVQPINNILEKGEQEKNSDHMESVLEQTGEIDLNNLKNITTNENHENMEDHELIVNKTTPEDRIPEEVPKLAITESENPLKSLTAILTEQPATANQTIVEVPNTAEKESNANSEVDDGISNEKWKNNKAVDLETLKDVPNNIEDELEVAKEQEQPKIEKPATESEDTSEKIVEIERKDSKESSTQPNEDLNIENAIDDAQMAAMKINEKPKNEISNKEDVSMENVSDEQLEEPAQSIIKENNDLNEIPKESLLQTRKHDEVENELQSKKTDVTKESSDRSECNENLDADESVLDAKTNDEVDNGKPLKSDDGDKDTVQHSEISTIEPADSLIEAKEPHKEEYSKHSDQSIIKQDEAKVTDKVIQSPTKTTDEVSKFEQIVLEKMAANNDTTVGEETSNLTKSEDKENLGEAAEDGAEVVEDIIEKSILTVLGDDTLIEALAEEITGTEHSKSMKNNEDEIDKMFNEVQNIDVVIEEDNLKKTKAVQLQEFERELNSSKDVEQGMPELSRLEDKENVKDNTTESNLLKNEISDVKTEMVENIDTFSNETEKQSKIVDSSTLEDLNVGNQEKEKNQIEPTVLKDEIGDLKVDTSNSKLNEDVLNENEYSKNVDSNTLKEHNEREPKDDQAVENKIMKDDNDPVKDQSAIMSHVEPSESSLKDKNELENVETDPIEHFQEKAENLIEKPKEIEEVAETSLNAVDKVEETSGQTTEQDPIQNVDESEENETPTVEKNAPTELEAKEEQTEVDLIPIPTTLEKLNSEFGESEANSNKFKRSLSEQESNDVKPDDSVEFDKKIAEEGKNSTAKSESAGVELAQEPKQVESSEELPKETLGDSGDKTLKATQLDEENNNDTAFSENLAAAINVKQIPLDDQEMKKMEPLKKMSIEPAKVDEAAEREIAKNLPNATEIYASSASQAVVPMEDTRNSEIGRLQPQTNTTTIPTTIGTQNSPPPTGSKVVCSETSSNEKSKTLPPSHPSNKLSKQNQNPHTSIVDQKIYTDKYMGLPIAEIHLKSFKAVNALEAFPWFDESKDKKSSDTEDSTKISYQSEEKKIANVLVQETSNESQSEITTEAQEIAKATDDFEINQQSNNAEIAAKSPKEYDPKETIPTSNVIDGVINENISPIQAISSKPTETPTSIPETERTATYLYGVHKPRLSYKPPTSFVIPIEGRKKRGRGEPTAPNPTEINSNAVAKELEEEDSIDLETPTKLFEELSAFDYELENDTAELSKYSLNDTYRMDEIGHEQPLIVYSSSDIEDPDVLVVVNPNDDNDKTSHLSVILEQSECESPAPLANDTEKSYNADYWEQLYALHENRARNIHETGKVYNNALENMKQQSEDVDNLESRNAKEKINYFEQVQNLPHIVKACTTIQHSYRRYAQKRKSVVEQTQNSEVKSDIHYAATEASKNSADSLLTREMDNIVDALSPVNSSELLPIAQESSTNTSTNKLQVKHPQTIEDLRQFIEACVKIQRFYRRHVKNRPKSNLVNLRDANKKATPNDGDLKEFVKACIRIQRFYRRYVKNKPRLHGNTAIKDKDPSEEEISVENINTLHNALVSSPNDKDSNERLPSTIEACITIQRFYRRHLLKKSNEFRKEQTNMSSHLSNTYFMSHEEEPNDVATLMSGLPSIPSNDPSEDEQSTTSNSPANPDMEHLIEACIKIQRFYKEYVKNKTAKKLPKNNSVEVLDSTFNVVKPTEQSQLNLKNTKGNGIIFNTSDIHDLAHLTHACVKIQRFYRQHLNKKRKQDSLNNSATTVKSLATDVELIQPNPDYKTKGIHDLAHLTQACVKIQRFYRQRLNKNRKQEAFPKSVKSSETEYEFIEPHNFEGAMHDLQHLTEACVTIQRFYRRRLQNTNRTQYSRVKQISAPTTNSAMTNAGSAVDVPTTPTTDNLHMSSDDVKAIDKLKYLSTCRTSPENAVESHGRSFTDSSFINNDSMNDLRNLIEACIKIQRFYRRCMANRMNSNNNDNDMMERNLKFHQAAIIIQQHFRAYMERKQTAGTINNRTEIEGNAINVQNSSEKLNGDPHVQGLAAVVIQNAFRAYMRRHKQLTSEDIATQDEQHAENGDPVNAKASTHDRNSTNGNNLIAVTPDTSTTISTTKVNWFVGNDPIVPTHHHATDTVPEDSHPIALEVENAESSSNSTNFVDSACDEVPVAQQSEIVVSANDTFSKYPHIHTTLNNLNALNNLDAQGEIITDPIENQVTKEEMPMQEEIDDHGKERLKRQTETETIDDSESYVPITDVLREFLEKERANALPQPTALTQPSLVGNITDIVIKSLANSDNLQTPIPYEKLPQLQAESNDSLSSLDQQSGSIASNSNTELEDTSQESSLDTITEKLQNNQNDEIIDKMAKRRASQPKIEGGIGNLIARGSFEEPHIKALQDNEDDEQIVLKHLDSDEQQRLTSADSATIVMGYADEEIGVNFQTSPVYKGAFKRLHTIAGGDERSLLKSVTIDETVQYIDASSATSGSSFCLDDDTTAEIRHKMMAYSMSEGDSDFMGVRTSAMGISTDDRIPSVSHDDFNISTALVDTTGASTDTESTIVSAVTKIQAGARGFLARRRLQRFSGGTKSSLQTDTKASFGNAAIDESLERLVEDVAAKKIQTAYRRHYRKNMKAKERPSQMDNSMESALAAKRSTLQRGDALRNYSTPDEETDASDNNGAQTKSAMTTANSEPRGSKSKRTPRERAATVKMATEMRWPAMRQYSMPVQIESEIFRVIPKHKRKRIRSAETDKKGY